MVTKNETKIVRNKTKNGLKTQDKFQKTTEMGWPLAGLVIALRQLVVAIDTSFPLIETKVIQKPFNGLMVYAAAGGCGIGC